MSPLRLMGTGLALLVASWGAVFLMVLRAIPPDLVVALVAYGMSVVGLGLGVAGAALWARSRGAR
ncbi:MAG: hypothetical protein ACK45F_03250 [bacterium]